MIIKYLLFIYYVAYSSLLYAAGFDCSKSNTNVEVLICGNKDLSNLDSQLGRLYSEIKNTNSNLQAEQKKWLVNVRGKCDSEDCLFNVYRGRIKELGNIQSCTDFSKKIIGRWVDSKDGFFEEFSLSNNNGVRRFGSWRHHRPELFGEWSINSCKLNISGADTSVDFEFLIKRIDKNRLYLINEDGGEEVYRR